VHSGEILVGLGLVEDVFLLAVELGEEVRRQAGTERYGIRIRRRRLTVRQRCSGNAHGVTIADQRH